MVKMDVNQDEALVKSLRHIDRNLINKATLKALRQMAKPVLRDAKAEAPTDTHVLARDLSIATFINKKDRSVAICHVGLSKKNHPEWLKIRGLAMEYGNQRVSAQTYLAKAADRNRKPVYSDFRQFLEKHLDKLVARA